MDCTPLDAIDKSNAAMMLQSSQTSKIFEQMSTAVERNATRIWILNVGDLKPYEMDSEFFLTYGWNSSRWWVHLHVSLHCMRNSPPASTGT
jgi:hypothetical protein